MSKSNMEPTYQELCYMAGITVEEANHLGLSRVEIINLVKLAA